MIIDVDELDRDPRFPEFIDPPGHPVVLIRDRAGYLGTYPNLDPTAAWAAAAVLSDFGLLDWMAMYNEMGMVTEGLEAASPDPVTFSYRV
jgi:hypothetical protein